MDSEINWKEFYEKEAEFNRCIPEEDPSEIHRTNLVMSLLSDNNLNSVLDVGCGDGYLCHLYRGMGVENVVGCDLTETRINFAKSKFKEINFVQGDVYNLHFNNNSFDLVSAVEVIEHLEDPEKAIKELQRVSKRFVLITVPYKEELTNLVCPHCLRLFPCDSHIQSFDVIRIKSICTNLGLKIIKIEKYHPIFVTGILRYIPKLLLPLLKRTTFKDIVERSIFLGVLCEKVE